MKSYKRSSLLLLLMGLGVCSSGLDVKAFNEDVMYDVESNSVIEGKGVNKEVGIDKSDKLDTRYVVYSKDLPNKENELYKYKRTYNITGVGTEDAKGKDAYISYMFSEEDMDLTPVKDSIKVKLDGKELSGVKFVKKEHDYYLDIGELDLSTKKDMILEVSFDFKLKYDFSKITSKQPIFISDSVQFGELDRYGTPIFNDAKNDTDTFYTDIMIDNGDELTNNISLKGDNVKDSSYTVTMSPVDNFEKNVGAGLGDGRIGILYNVPENNVLGSKFTGEVSIKDININGKNDKDSVYLSTESVNTRYLQTLHDDIYGLDRFSDKSKDTRFKGKHFIKWDKLDDIKKEDLSKYKSVLYFTENYLTKDRDFSMDVTLDTKGNKGGDIYNNRYITSFIKGVYNHYYGVDAGNFCELYGDMQASYVSDEQEKCKVTPEEEKATFKGDKVLNSEYKPNYTVIKDNILEEQGFPNKESYYNNEDTVVAKYKLFNNPQDIVNRNYEALRLTNSSNILQYKIKEDSKEENVLKENKDTEVKENKGTEVKENKDTEVKENKDTEVKENKGTEVKENKDTEVKENKDTSVKNSKTTEIKENKDNVVAHKETKEDNNLVAKNNESDFKTNDINEQSNKNTGDNDVKKEVIKGQSNKIKDNSVNEKEILKEQSEEVKVKDDVKNNTNLSKNDKEKEVTKEKEKNNSTNSSKEDNLENSENNKTKDKSVKSNEKGSKLPSTGSKLTSIVIYLGTLTSMASVVYLTKKH